MIDLKTSRVDVPLRDVLRIEAFRWRRLVAVLSLCGLIAGICAVLS